MWGLFVCFMVFLMQLSRKNNSKDFSPGNCQEIELNAGISLNVINVPVIDRKFNPRKEQCLNYPAPAPDEKQMWVRRQLLYEGTERGRSKLWFFTWHKKSTGSLTEGMRSSPSFDRMICVLLAWVLRSLDDRSGAQAGFGVTWMLLAASPKQFSPNLLQLSLEERHRISFQYFGAAL